MMQGKWKFTPAELAQRAQDATHRALSQRAGELFREALGANWAQQLADRFEREEERRRIAKPEYKGRFPFRIKDSRPTWDFAQLLYALIDNVDLLPSCRRNSGTIKSLCFRLRDGRNALAHRKGGDPEVDNVDFARKHIENGISLIQLLGGAQELGELRSYLDELLNPGGTSPEVQTAATVSAEQQQETQAELKNMRAMLESIVRKLDEPRSETKEPTASIRVPLEAAAPVRSDPIRTQARRRMPLPAAEAGMVLFPIVAKGADAADLGEFGFFRCRSFVPEGRQDILARVTGFELQGRSDAFYKVIDDARASETDLAKASLYTHSRVVPGDFTGTSFGLAAAIADQLARFGRHPNLDGRHIIATGAITRGGEGEIDAIDSFPEKLDFLLRSAPRPALFLFPRKNRDLVTNTDLSRMEELARSGVELRAVSHVRELIDLRKPATPVVEVAKEEPTAPHPLATPSATVATKGMHHRFRPAAAMILVGGISLLAALYGASAFMESMRVDPEATARLQKLVDAYPGGDGDAFTASQCEQLAIASKAISDRDRKLFAANHLSAMAAGEVCVRRIQASDRRISSAKNTADQIAATSATLESCASLSVTTAALEKFDRARSDALVKSIDATQRTCLPLLADSDKRLTAFNQAGSRAKSNGDSPKACVELITASDALLPVDRDRLGERSRAADEITKQCRDRLSDSESRIQALRDAARGGIQDSMANERLASLRSTLTAFDRAREDSESRRVIGLADWAWSSIRESDGRIKPFLAAYSEWRQGGSLRQALALDAANSRLTEFDRNRSSGGEMTRALDDMPRLEKQLSASQQRWTRLGTLTRQAEQLSPADYWQNLNDLVSRIGQDEIDLATASQKSTLRRARELLDAGNASPRGPIIFGR